MNMSNQAKSNNKKTNRRRKNRRRSGRQIAPQGNRGAPAPVSIGQTVSNVSRGFSARQNAVDYINNVSFDGLRDGSTLFQLRIDPSIFPTASRFCSSYQRYVMHKLVFRLSAHMPTSSAGGYIMGFRADPTDKLPELALNKKRFVAGTPGSVKNPIWQSYDMVIPQRMLTRRLLYTSEGSDLREFSPGVLFVVVDGAVNETGSLSLSIEYDLTCSEPALDYAVEEESSVVEVLQNDKSRLYIYDGENYFRSGDTSSTPTAHWSDYSSQPRPLMNVLFSGIQFGSKDSAEASQDIEYTHLLAYDSYEDILYIVHRWTNGEGYAPVPSKSPSGNTQVLTLWSQLKRVALGVTIGGDPSGN